MTLEQLEASLSWAKHHAASKWCRVEGFAGGSVLTVCRGRFSARDSYETAESPPVADRCGGCVSLAAVEAGLAELKHAAVIETVDLHTAPAVTRGPAVNFAWDMTDEQGGEG